MYHYQCDWCGESIDTDKPYVRCKIVVVTGRTDYLNRDDNDVEPTRFFHVAPRRSREDWNRLGLEVRSEKIGGCCYTRALRAIEGGDFDEPDAGMKWRLMPVDGEVEDTSSGERRGKRGDELMALKGVAWTMRCKIREFTAARETARASADDADRHIGWLNVSIRTYNAFNRAGVKSLQDLQNAVKAGSLLAIPGIGQKALDEIEAALDELVTPIVLGFNPSAVSP